MTGDKPDPRLRTPMQWAPRPGYGFTTGNPWEPAQPDSLSTTVAAENRDSSSLLNLYRRLIHLRRSNDALATGHLIGLTASDPHVAAYLRRAGNQAVLVVANLGDSVVRQVTLAAASGTLPPGTYRVTSLLGRVPAQPPTVDGTGRIRDYIPTAEPLAPRTSLILELQP